MQPRSKKQPAIPARLATINVSRETSARHITRQLTNDSLKKLVSSK
jgi:hypothetical protein